MVKTITYFTELSDSKFAGNIKFITVFKNCAFKSFKKDLLFL